MKLTCKKCGYVRTFEKVIIKIPMYERIEEKTCIMNEEVIPIEVDVTKKLNIFNYFNLTKLKCPICGKASHEIRGYNFPVDRVHTL